MGLKSLLPIIGKLQSPLKTLGGPTAVPRMSGRRAVHRRRRWLANHPLCVHCQKEGIVRPADEVDHIVALNDLDGPGADDESNFQSLCFEHHKAKSAAEAQRRGGHGSGR